MRHLFHKTNFATQPIPSYPMVSVGAKHILSHLRSEIAFKYTAARSADEILIELFTSLDFNVLGECIELTNLPPIYQELIDYRVDLLPTLNYITQFIRGVHSKAEPYATFISCRLIQADESMLLFQVVDFH